MKSLKMPTSCTKFQQSINGGDGQFSSAVIGFSLVSICFVIITVLSPFDSLGIARGPWAVTSFITTIGVVSTFGVWILIKRNKQYWLKKGKTKDLSMNVKMVFLWVFGVTNMLYLASVIAVNFDCIVNDQKELFNGQYYLGILSEVITTFFYIGQMCFLSSFSKRMVKSSPIMSYGMAFIIMTHLVHWFNNLYNNLHQMKLKMNYQKGNETNNGTGCCYLESDLNIFRNHLKPVIKPSLAEYSLLAVELILRMWMTTNQEENSDTKNTKNTDYDETTYLLCEETHITGLNDNSEIVSKQPPRQENTRLKKPTRPGDNSIYFCGLTGLLLCLPFLVTTFFVTFTEYTLEKRYALLIVQILFFIEHIILLTMAFVHITKHSSWKKESKLTASSLNSRVILLLCTAGYVCFNTFEILAGVLQPSACFDGGSKGNSIAANLVILKGVLEILIIFWQTILIRNSDTWINQKLHSKKCLVVKRCFGIICFMNLTMWFLSSVIFDFTDKIMRVESCFYGQHYWNMILDVVFPISIFYRFHSAMHLYDRYKRYR